MLRTEKLSEKHVRVYRLKSRGETFEDIGRALGISKQTASGLYTLRYGAFSYEAGRGKWKGVTMAVRGQASI